MTERLRVVVADDSPFVCNLLSSYMREMGEIDVIATAHDGRDAVGLVRELRPEVVTLDIEMPTMDGLEAIREIMKSTPTPVIVVSGVSGRSATRTLQALDAGAVDFILKFLPGAGIDPEAMRREVVAKVRAAAAIRVVRTLRLGDAVGDRLPAALSAPPPSSASGSLEVVVIGASTGGPVALRELLSALPANFSAAILIVQHMPASFTSVLASQLGRHCALPVLEAADGDRLEPGRVFVAPGGFHLLAEASGSIVLHDGPAVGGHRPSIDVTMQAIAHTFGPRAVGVVLAGMGDDGAQGLFAIRARGGETLAQDEATSVVWGMPRSAVERGGVGEVAPPHEIAARLVEQTGTHGSPAWVASNSNELLYGHKGRRAGK